MNIFKSSLLITLAFLLITSAQAQKVKRYLYVVTPGVRNYLGYGGHGINATSSTSTTTTASSSSSRRPAG